eukprot:1816486-Alexandrium_andersonii.AAC.1
MARRVWRILRGEEEARPWGLAPNGDLWQVVQQLVRQRWGAPPPSRPRSRVTLRKTWLTAGCRHSGIGRAMTLLMLLRCGAGRLLGSTGRSW